jgi:branched-chain amino acid transport system permease protein
VPLPALAPTASGTIYRLGLALAVIALGAAYAVGHSRLGMGLFAIHDDEDVAEVKGVPTFRYKLIAIAISSGIAGAAGAVQAIYVGYVTVGETFAINVPLYVVLMSVLGGARHWLGPAVGATLITVALFVFASCSDGVFQPRRCLRGMRRAQPLQLCR